MTRIRLLLAAICLFLISTTSYGQAVYGSIFGTVTDPTGAVVPNAAVTVTNVAKGTASGEVSNGSGEFTADHLIPDIYDVKVTASGFQTFGEDYDVDHPNMQFTIKLKRPQDQYSIYGDAPSQKKDNKPPPDPNAKPQ